MLFFYFFISYSIKDEYNSFVFYRSFKFLIRLFNLLISQIKIINENEQNPFICCFNFKLNLS